MITTLSACSIYAVVDTSKAMIVTRKISEDRYEVHYQYHGKDYFMHVLSEEIYKPGDTLQLVLKSDF